MVYCSTLYVVFATILIKTFYDINSEFSIEFVNEWQFSHLFTNVILMLKTKTNDNI